MSLSRGIHLMRRLNVGLSKKSIGQTVESVRNSGGLYSYRRTGYEPSTRQILGANILSGFMWWWILWHVWHEPDHITGEFTYPDPSKWTNEELGIPPLDAE